MPINYQNGLIGLQPLIENRIARLKKEGFIKRFCNRDAALWSQSQNEIDEINRRLDWLDAPRSSRAIIIEAEELRKGLLRDGFSHAVVLGMGGSSLAPEVYSRVAGRANITSDEHLTVLILDTTDPEQISIIRKKLDLERTIFIVSSKSGTTAEINALLAYFWHEVEQLNTSHPGRQFIAISDPGTSLIKLGVERAFRKVIEANPNVGGRFSALIEFGLFPAVLCGFDGHKLLQRAEKQMIECSCSESIEQYPGIILGVILAEAFLNGKDKLTILADAGLPAFGAWLEQLVAESSGKNGVGIVPIDQEPLLEMENYSRDRLFIRITSQTQSGNLNRNYTAEGHPVITMPFVDIHDLAALFYIWEIAISTACAIIGVNAFNQPDVQMSKSITSQLMDLYQSQQSVDTGRMVYSDKQVCVYGNLENCENADHIKEITNTFFKNAKEGDYIAINAFVPMSEPNQNSLEKMRKKLGERYSLPTTVGFGPRFLHSTGQLHKGGSNSGIFLVLTEEKQNDIEIPDQDFSFGKLQLIQAIGDTRALEQLGRRVIRIHLRPGALENVIEQI